MKITVKTLKGEMMQIDVEPTTTITELKSKIQEIKGFDIQGQKIVFKGKATQNQDTIDKLSIKEKDFLVVMFTVKKPEAKKQQPKKQEKVQEKKQTAENKQVKTENKPQQKAQKKQDPAFQNKVNQLMSMGFPRDTCVQALRAAFGNSQVAIEYVLNGIPAGLGAEGQGHASNNPLGGMLGAAQFQELRQVLRNDPTAIGPLLQQLAQTSPQLYNLISQHPEEFERMILEGGQGEDYIEGEQSMQPEGQQGAIMVTQAEKQAIERLSQLGFSKAQAAQAYLACDKNEQMAANLLFDRLANGDIEQGGFEDYQEQHHEGDDDDDNLFN